MTLQEFIRLRHRFQWGGSGTYDADGRFLNDCHTVCASWALQLTGIDPAAQFRGTYSDADGARAIVDDAGGSVPLIAAQILPLGFKRVQNPQSGDIGVVVAPSGFTDDFARVGAIRFGPTWACLGTAGMVAKPLQMIACWRFSA